MWTSLHFEEKSGPGFAGNLACGGSLRTLIAEINVFLQYKLDQYNYK